MCRRGAKNTAVCIKDFPGVPSPCVQQFLLLENNLLATCTVQVLSMYCIHRRKYNSIIPLILDLLQNYTRTQQPTYFITEMFVLPFGDKVAAPQAGDATSRYWFLYFWEWRYECMCNCWPGRLLIGCLGADRNVPTRGGERCTAILSALCTESFGEGPGHCDSLVFFGSIRLQVFVFSDCHKCRNT